MTLAGEPPPPTIEELRARPVGRTGAELVMRMRDELLLVTWDSGAGTGEGVFRVTDTEDRLLMILGTAGPVHSAVVFLALAAMKHWQAPARREGYTTYPPERLPTGAVLYAVLANDFPIAIGLGSTEAAAFQDLARLRHAGR